jgi:glycosyltransferase involved in cell wall biosynthesis
VTVRPKIVHVISGLGPGGAEIMLLELIRQSASSAFDPMVVNLSYVGGLIPEFEKIGIPVVTLGMGRGIPDPRVIFRLRSLLRREKAAVVQTWMYHANLIGGVAARMAGSIPVAWGIHHTDLSPDYIKRPTLMVAKACVPLSRRIPSSIVCVAETSRRVHADLGYDTSKIVVIPNGFDTDRFRPDPEARTQLRVELGLPAETKLVGILARFHPQKDHKNFVDAAAIVAEHHADAHFVLCGWDVDEKNAQLVDWIAASGFQNRFHLLGRRADTPRIAAAMDVIALSSQSGEAFPLVIGEAMSCGVPCAVTDVGDSRLIVGDLGRVAPPKNPLALASAIEELLVLTPEERTRVAQACRRKIADNFSLQEIARRYDSLWREIANPERTAISEQSVSCV